MVAFRVPIPSPLLFFFSICPFGRALSSGGNQGIDPTISQCQFMDDNSVICKTRCSYEQKVVVLDSAKHQKVLQRDCDGNQAPFMHRWNKTDGILDEFVYPEEAPVPKHPKLIAVCTFAVSKPVFECVGVSTCSEGVADFDTCNGGIPWRGKRINGHPLNQGAALTGIITVNARDTNASAPPRGPGANDLIEDIAPMTSTTAGSHLRSLAPSSKLVTHPVSRQSGSGRITNEKPPATPGTPAAVIKECSTTAPPQPIVCTAAGFWIRMNIWTCYHYDPITTDDPGYSTAYHREFFKGLFNNRRLFDDPNRTRCEVTVGTFNCSAYTCDDPFAQFPEARCRRWADESGISPAGLFESLAD